MHEKSIVPRQIAHERDASKGTIVFGCIAIVFLWILLLAETIADGPNRINILIGLVVSAGFGLMILSGISACTQKRGLWIDEKGLTWTEGIVRVQRYHLPWRCISKIETFRPSFPWQYLEECGILIHLSMDQCSSNDDLQLRKIISKSVPSEGNRRTVCLDGNEWTWDPNNALFVLCEALDHYHYQ